MQRKTKMELLSDDWAVAEIVSDIYRLFELYPVTESLEIDGNSVTLSLANGQVFRAEVTEIN
jgi:hypothetical protein